MALLALASLGSQRVTAGDMGSAGNFQAQEMWFKKKKLTAAACGEGVRSWSVACSHQGLVTRNRGW